MRPPASGLHGGDRLRNVVVRGGSAVLLDHSGPGVAIGRLATPIPEPRLEPAEALGQPSAPAWIRRVMTLLVCCEALAAGVAGGAVLLSQPDDVPLSSPLFGAAAALVVVWPLLLTMNGAYSVRIFGTGSDEYRRVGRAGLTLLAVAGFASYAAQLDLSRALVVVAVPSLTVATLIGRFVARR